MDASPAERMAAARARARHPLTSQFAEQYSFPFDDFQRAGCQSLEDGRSVLVAAPTGAGKTIVGEFAAFLADHTGTRCFYTTPIKALSNQKYQEMVKTYGPSHVGLLTGDSSINGDAPIVVMTTEVLRNMIYANPDAIKELGYVVMDEVHYLADKFRGAVWKRYSFTYRNGFRSCLCQRRSPMPRSLANGSSQCAVRPMWFSPNYVPFLSINIS